LFFIANLIGRVVKRPSWAEVYTDQGVIEPDDEWTPETKKKFSSDSFKPRAPPAVSKSALGKAHSELVLGVVGPCGCMPLM